MATQGAFAPTVPNTPAEDDVSGIGILSLEQFTAVAESEIERTRRQGTPLSLLSIGVDRFNKGRGAPAAPDDRAVPALATTCVGLLRATDVIGVVDEATVVVLLPGTSAISTLRIAERLRTAMASASSGHTPARRCQSTVSIGAVTTRTGKAAYRALRSRADAKRDDARSRGGNRVES